MIDFQNTSLMEWVLVGNVLDTGHVPDISLGRGHVLKSCWQNWMAGHIFHRILSATCLSCVLGVSHVFDTLKKQRKRECKSTKSSKFTFGWLIWFCCNNFFLKFFFCNYKTVTDSKMKKMEVSTKDLLHKHFYVSQSTSDLSPPLCPSWSQIKFFFFHFFHFLKKPELIILILGGPHNLCSSLQILKTKKWLTMSTLVFDCP